MRPLDQLRSIKTKLGVVIVAAVAVTVIVVSLGLNAGLPLAACAIAASALALGMVQFLARGMTSPLREMASAATAMARGDYTRQVTASSRDEVGDLARAFTTMAAQLAEVDRSRRELLANVSHELRTPISALQAVLENLIDGVAPPDQQVLESMLQQVERLGRLVAQLLDLSRLESGVVPLERQRVALRPLLARVVEEARLQAQPKAFDVAVVADDDLEAHADPERVHQVVRNLLDNAIRHSPAGGKIMLAATRRSDGVTIEVSDEGPGIPPEDVERVFDRFYRSSQPLDDGGTGLGLSIARWIVELHGGDIRAERSAPTGCRMVVTLPQHAA